MGSKTPFIMKRGGVFWFVRNVPKDVQPAVGRRQWWRSLHTDSRKQAEREVHKFVTATDLIIARVRETNKAMGGKSLTVAEVAAALAEKAEPAFIGTLEATITAAEKVAKAAQVIGKEDALAAFQHGSGAREMAEDLKPYEAARQSVGRVVAIWQGTDKENADAARPSPSGGLHDVFSLWKTRAKPADRTADEAEVAVRHFDEVNGPLAVEAITRAHVLAFRAAMLEMPKHLTREDAAMTVPRILAKFAGSPAERVSPTTARKRLGFIKTLMALALEEGLIEVNPASDVRIGGEKTAQVRLAFDLDDLRRMFSTAPYRPGGERGAMFWLPLLGLLTGARAGELLQLTPADVRQEGGITYLSITDDDGKALKTNGSRRNVPVHPELIRLGFLDYAKNQRERIFEEIPFGAAQISAVYSKKYNYWLRNTVGITDKRKVLHSLRHSFKVLCREAGIGEDIHDSITGHQNGSVGRRYGHMPLTTLDRAIRSIKCPVDLGRL